MRISDWTSYVFSCDLAGYQDRCVLEIVAVEQIIGIGAQRLERVRAHPLARRGLQPVRGKDDGGVDILEPERDRATFDFCQRGHASNSRTSVSLPVTAAAASIAGLTRWVRLPGP